MDKVELTKLFEKLGASAPERWAASQVDEGVPQLLRFLFLRQAWNHVVAEDDPSWIDEQMKHAAHSPEASYAGVGRALAALRERGATDLELTDLVRGMQVLLLSDICHLLDDPGELEPEVSDIWWQLMQMDDEENPQESITGLHESVLETDPTGREMRPRPIVGTE